ncbi:hypothetical protein ATO8_19654 [Roseivivax marinus]|jgi:hypothetical protein|uniref:Lipoprotein n=1 Tax=Roseivivax marinus TaxID=1379903 RepID=W4HG29_9RHOB|nr:DUF3833 family protein [Roseivivax marinus]ETW10925.1 hypothetical protein ATO8_19654 [Roseivivax marinus]
MAIMTGLAVALAVILGFVLLRDRMASFAAQRPKDYADMEPEFDLRTHLSGPILCEGVVYGPLGRVSSRFVGDFNVTWDGDRGVMEETFTYDSGEVQRRAWHLKLKDSGEIEAHAKDVIGTGHGWQSGPSVMLRYRIRLEEDAGGHVLDAIDWMYLAPNGTIVNRSQFRKFGLKVAELVATMRRKETA